VTARATRRRARQRDLRREHGGLREYFADRLGFVEVEEEPLDDEAIARLTR
jgi:hypothetical protein